MKLLITGGRTWGVAKLEDPPEREAEAEQERDTLIRALNAFHARHGIRVLIHGAAAGADTLADRWAKTAKTPGGARLYIARFPADWKRLGGRAGPVRNARMLQEGRPDAVLSFPGGRGTEGMIRLAMKAGVPVWRVYRPVIADASLFGAHGNGAERHQRPITLIQPPACPHSGRPGEWHEVAEMVFCEACES